MIQTVSPDFSFETSCCRDEIAFFRAVRSVGPSLLLGGKSKTDVLSTSSIGICIHQQEFH